MVSKHQSKFSTQGNKQLCLTPAKAVGRHPGEFRIRHKVVLIDLKGKKIVLYREVKIFKRIFKMYNRK